MSEPVKAYLANPPPPGSRPYYSVPADLEGYNQMVEQIAKRLSRGWIQDDYSEDQSYTRQMQAYYRRRARTVLTAIGINRPKS